MRRIQGPDIQAAAGLILSVCTLLVLSGWDGCSKGQRRQRTPPRPSPILVSDGSMSIHTGSPWNLKTNEVDIYGGQTCSISVNGSPPTPWKAQDWSITSHDGLAKVWSTNSGANITATGPSIRNAQMDSQYGRGKDLGMER
jgi:hypothetical protein